MKIEIPMSYLFLFRYRLSFQKLINFTKKIYIYIHKNISKKQKSPRRGIEPRSPAWQAGILTTILTRMTYVIDKRMCQFKTIYINGNKIWLGVRISQTQNNVFFLYKVKRNSLIWSLRNIRISNQFFELIQKKRSSPRRGIEPRSPAWQAGILTTILTRISYRFVEITQSYITAVFCGKCLSF